MENVITVSHPKEIIVSNDFTMFGKEFTIKFKPPYPHQTIIINGKKIKPDRVYNLVNGKLKIVPLKKVKPPDPVV